MKLQQSEAAGLNLLGAGLSACVLGLVLACMRSVRLLDLPRVLFLLALPLLLASVNYLLYRFPPNRREDLQVTCSRPQRLLVGL
jgi:hypothetical protein